MAKQGNYVTVSGGSGANPFKGISDSLADLSKMYTGRDTVDREEALQRDKLETEQQRWDITNKRQQLAADRTTEAYNTKQAMTDWYKSFGDTYNLDDLSRQKAKKDFGVTDEQLNSPLGRNILDEVQKTIYQEDVAKRYGKDFTKQFGVAFDPSIVKSVYGDRSSLGTLQAAEEANAKNRFETAKFFVGKRIEAAGKLDPTGTSGTSKKGTSKIPKTFNDIMIADLVKDFDKDSTLWFDSEKEDARDVAKYTLDILEGTQKPDKTPKYNAAQAKAMTEFVLDRLRTGEDLKDVNDAKGKIAELIADAEEGMTHSYKAGDTGSGGRKGNATAREYLEKALSTDLDPNAFNPRDVRTIRRTAAQQAIDKLLGRAPKPSTTTTKPKRPAKSGQNERWPLDKLPTSPEHLAPIGELAAATALLPKNIPQPISAPVNAVPQRAVGNPTLQNRVMTAIKEAALPTYPEQQGMPVPPRQRTVDPSGIVLPSLGNLVDRKLTQAYNKIAPRINRLSQAPRRPGLTDAEYEQLLGVLGKK